MSESRNLGEGEGGVTCALLNKRKSNNAKQNRLTFARQNTATRHDSSE